MKAKLKRVKRYLNRYGHCYKCGDAEELEIEKSPEKTKWVASKPQITITEHCCFAETTIQLFCFLQLSETPTQPQVYKFKNLIPKFQ